MIHGPHTYQHREGDAHQWLCRFGIDNHHTVTGTTTKTAITVRDHGEGDDAALSCSGSLVSLSWNTADPFAVTLLIHDKLTGEPTSWQFSRDLLVNGGGVGDVRIRHGLVTSIELDSPSEHMVLRLCVTWTERFIGYTEEVMPLGTEPSLADAGELEWSNMLARLVDRR
jgi:hypothetical protein